MILGFLFLLFWVAIAWVIIIGYAYLEAVSHEKSGWISAIMMAAGLIMLNVGVYYFCKDNALLVKDLRWKLLHINIWPVVLVIAVISAIYVFINTVYGGKKVKEQFKEAIGDVFVHCLVYPLIVVFAILAIFICLCLILMPAFFFLGWI